MKRYLFAVLLFLLAGPAVAAAFPSYINYQGKLGNPSGTPLTGTYSFRFRLYTQATGGTLLATDANYTGANAVSVTNGLYSVQIGSLTAEGLPESAFLGAEAWLEIDVSPGTDFTGSETLAPRERLAATPFAFRAAVVDKLGAGVALATFTSAGNLELPYGVTGGTASFTRLGVGIAAPTAGLSVLGGPAYFNANSGFQLEIDDSTNAGSNQNVAFKRSGTTVSTMFNTPTNELTFQTIGQPLRFKTDASNERMRVDSMGEVAIGLTVPAARLHVSSASAVASNSIFLVSSGTAAGQELLIVKGDGKFGVGTSSPAARLHVSGGDAQVGDATASTISASGYLTLANVDEPAAAKGRVYYDSTLNTVRFSTGATASSWVNISTTSQDGGLPSGMVSFFNLASCPSGWTELTTARGRSLVGLPLSGTLAGTAGTALTNLEDRPVGQHNHAITDPGHVHGLVTSIQLYGAPALGSGVETQIGSSNTGSAVTGITINNAGSTAGTNAPYLQLLVCSKN